MARILVWFKAHAKLLVSLIGVACIPLIYCGLLIAANSDPIGRLNGVPALVVNLDTAATTSTGESIDLGPRIVEELENSDEASNLKWAEASEQEANRALADGQALAVLTIPEGFSAAAASAGDDDPQKAHAGQLQVRTNDASNYLMGTIARSVGTEVTSSVRSQVSEEYLKNVYVGFSDLHSSLSDASDGASKLADGTGDAHDGSGELVVGLNKLKDGSAQVDGGAVKLASGAKTLSEGATSLSSGLDELQDKTKDLPSQSKQLNDGAQKIAAGTKTLNTSAGQLNDGAQKLATGTKTLNTSAGQLNDGAQKLATGTKTLNTSAGQLNQGAQQVAAGNKKLNTTAQGIATSVKGVTDGVSETLGSLGTLIEDTTGISSSTKIDVSGTAAGAQADLKKLMSDPQVQAAIQAAGLEDQATSLKQDLSAVAAGAAKTDAAIKKAEQAAGKVHGQGGTSIAELQAEAKKVGAAADTFAASTQALSDGSAKVAAGTKKLSESTPALNSGAKQLAEGTKKLSQATPTLKDGASKLAAGTKKLSESTPALKDGASKLAAGTKKLSESTPTLKDGAASLAAGTAQLNKAVPTLSKAIGSASAGGQKLASGAKELSSGAKTLSTGTGDLAKGTADADTGATKLDKGLKDLQEGADKLDSGLSDGVKEVPNYSENDRQHLSTVNADPVSLDDASENSMANYGTGLAPYFISLALWIGGIAFFMLMAPLPRKLLDRHLPAPVTALRAYVPSAIMALVQATIVTAVTLWVLRLDVAHPVILWGLAMFASLTFLAVNQGLVSLLGAPGRFLSLILVVLQIASAGGTYPWQTMPDFFQSIRPFLPMSYTVEAFRSLIAGGPTMGLGAAILVLAVYLVIGLLFLTLAAVLSRKVPALRDWATLAPGLPGGGRSVEADAEVVASEQRSGEELDGVPVDADGDDGVSAGAGAARGDGEPALVGAGVGAAAAVGASEPAAAAVAATSAADADEPMADHGTPAMAPDARSVGAHDVASEPAAPSQASAVDPTDDRSEESAVDPTEAPAPVPAPAPTPAPAPKHAASPAESKEDSFEAAPVSPEEPESPDALDAHESSEDPEPGESDVPPHRA